MNEADIEAEIQRISSRRVMGWEVQPGSKFSLAGTQGKFTLVKYGKGWYRPYVGLASTHIIKPSIRTLEGSASVECACMDIASLCGVETPWHGMITAGSQDAYIVERFDRRMREDGFADRLRTEDMTQALALSRDEKYDVECGDVVALLMRTDPSGELAYQWFKQVAFNAFIGNGDAHSKNYSLVLDKGDVRLSPIYDVVNTVMWRQFGEGLAMPVNGKYYASELTPSDWAAEANAAGLDGNKVAEAACDISRGILMHLDEAVAMLSPSLRDAMRDSVFKSNKGMQ